MDDGCYFVKNGEVYKVDLPIGMKPTKTVNIMTGEIRYPTNYDRVTHMSVEELANALAHKADACWNCSSDSLDICKDCWLDWLKQKAKP